jgi:hypothetical protein
VIYLTLPELVYIAERATGGKVAVRDIGLLESASARPQATAFGADAYPDLDTKAAALLHLLARNHALVDENKRLALGALGTSRAGPVRARWPGVSSALVGSMACAASPMRTNRPLA